MKEKRYIKRNVKKCPLNKGAVYVSNSKETTYIILQVLSLRNQLYEVLTIDKIGMYNCFEMNGATILNYLNYVGQVDTISVSVKVV